MAGRSNRANLTLCHLRNPCTLDLAAAAFLLTSVGHACSSLMEPPKGTFHQMVQLRPSFSPRPGAAHLLGGELLFSRVLWEHRNRVAQSSEELAKE